MLTQSNQKGTKYAIIDNIFMLSALKTPLLAELPKDNNATQSIVEWDVDLPLAVSDTVTHPHDADDHNSHAPDRHTAFSYVQYHQSDFLVEHLASRHELKGGKKEEAIMKIKAIQKKWGDIEAIISGDGEQDAGSGTTEDPRRTRSIGAYIEGDLQTGSFAFPEAYHPGSDQLITKDLTQLEIADINAAQQQQFIATDGMADNVLYCRPKLRTAISNLVESSQNSSTDTAKSIRVNMFDSTATRLHHSISFLSTDFGETRVVPDNRVGSLLSSNAASIRRGLMLTPSTWSLSYQELPNARKLEDRGAGPRMQTRAAYAVVCKNPLANSKVKSTTG